LFRIEPFDFFNDLSRGHISILSRRFESRNEADSRCRITLVTRHVFYAVSTPASVLRIISVSVNLYSMSSVIKIDPEIMSGAPCFAGTRVPIQNFIDYLEGGDSIEDFLEGFPSVSREQVIAFLEEAKECMLAAATK
jgi:uncharacterized protein (DUF433 family)